MAEKMVSTFESLVFGQDDCVLRTPEASGQCLE